MGALSGYRVLDLTVAQGWMCGRVLADLGAEVVKVEPPGGDPGRRFGLFADPSTRAVEENLSWWFENRGKASIVLDVETHDGREALLKLVDDADLLIESFDTGWLEEHGLGVDVLLERNPRLVVTSISAFGRTGPYARWSSTDLTIAATTGEMWLTGDPDRAPVRLSTPQMFLHAGVEAAVHSLVALTHACQTGVGQHVDVSAQLAALRCLMNAQAFDYLEGRELFRQGSFNNAGRSKFRIIYECLDGHVALLVAAGPIGGPMMRFLVDWAEREGFAHPIAKACDFETVNILSESDEFFDAVSSTLEGLFAKHTKQELYETALEQLLLLAPVNTVADLRADIQLDAREYFVRTEQGHGISWPGPWAKLSATPLSVHRRAPQVGEHTETELAKLRAQTIDGVETTARERPFEGLRVLDLAWVGVGPMTAGYLGAYGATVLKVESSKRPDVLRRNPPFVNGKPDINGSHFHGDFNPDKLGVGIDLTDPRGREIAWKMIEWADVIVESFTPRALAGWGMDYAEIRKRNPSVVMLSTCMQGQTGPRRNYRGFGNLMGGLAGFYELTGWPDRDPAMIFGAYTDFISQRFTTTALIAAIDHRRRTGEGQHIDVAQFEASLQFLGAEFLAYEIDGRVASRVGNRDRDLVPNGVFACRPEESRATRYRAGEQGAEAWVAISCKTDAQWTALAATIGVGSVAKWQTADGRRKDEDEIESIIGAWTRDRAAGEIVAALQPHVACAPVLGIPELHTDPQIGHRGYFVSLTHPVVGEVPYSGYAASMSKTPWRISTPAPCLGQHSWDVLESMFHVEADVLSALLVDGVLEITG